MMDIIKIGGAVLKDTKGFNSLINIIKNHTRKPLLVVISAFSSATKELKASAMTAELGELQKAKLMIEKVIREHRNFASSLIKDKKVFEGLDFLFDNSKEKLNELLKGLSITKELTAKTLDTIMSYGEFFALRIAYHFLLEKNFDISCIDSTSIIVSDSRFGAARPLLQETSKQVNKNLKPLLKKNKVVLTQGFVARNKSGEITTMGIESSNLTAVLLAELLNLKQISFWTDVEGVRSADPKLVQKTKAVKSLSYEDAYLLASNGLKLIHPEMIEHARVKNIKLRYISASKPNSSFTVVEESKAKLNTAVLLFKRNLWHLNIHFKSNDDRAKAEKLVKELVENTSNILSIKLNEDNFQAVFDSSNIPAIIKSSGFDDYEFHEAYKIAFISESLRKYTTKIQQVIENKSIQIMDLEITGNTLKTILISKNINQLVAEIHKII